MPRQPSKTFTDKELEIMQIIWELGEATVKQVQERLSGNRHYNSILTIIRVLERKGHLTHRVEGRAYIYRPKVAQEKARRRVLNHMVNSVFGGSAQSLVLNLIERGDLTVKDLEVIRQRVMRKGQTKGE